MTTAIVIGGGVIGSAAALNLQRRGISTRLVDPDPNWRGASIGNAGHIAVNEVEPLASWKTLRAMPGMLFTRGGPVGLLPGEIRTWLPFGLRLIRAAGRFEAGQRALTGLLGEALPAWRRLADEIGARDLLCERGHFVARADRIPEEGRAASEAERARVATLVQPAQHLTHVGSTAQIADLRLLSEALMARFAALGGERVRGRATVEGAEADIVLVTAGPASGELLRPLGHRVPLIAERGYHIQGAAPAWPEDMPTIVFEDRSVVVTRFRTALRATSFVEFGRAASPPDPRKWARLKRHAAELGLPFEGPVAEWMGARPTLPDYLPAIGRGRRTPHVYYAFGHQHLGLTLAAVTGEAIGALVAGETPPVDLAPFDLARFC